MGLARWEGNRLLQPHVHLECLFVEGEAPEGPAEAAAWPLCPCWLWSSHQTQRTKKQGQRCMCVSTSALMIKQGSHSVFLQHLCCVWEVRWRVSYTDLPAFLEQIIFKDEFNNRETLTSLFVEVSLNREPEVRLQAARCVQTENRFHSTKSLYHLCLLPTNSESNISNISVLLLLLFFFKVYIHLHIQRSFGVVFVHLGVVASHYFCLPTVCRWEGNVKLFYQSLFV